MLNCHLDTYVSEDYIFYNHGLAFLNKITRFIDAEKNVYSRVI